MIDIADSMRAIRSTMSSITSAKNSYSSYKRYSDSYYDSYRNASCYYSRRRYYASYSKYSRLASEAAASASTLYSSLRLQLRNLEEQAGNRADEVLEMKKEEKKLYELQLDAKALKSKNAENVLVTQARASYQLMKGVTKSLRTIDLRNKKMMLRTMNQLDEAARENLEDLEKTLMGKVKDINDNVDRLDDVNTRQAGSLVYSLTRAGSAKLDALATIARRKKGGKPLDAIFLGSIIGIGLAKAFWVGRKTYRGLEASRKSIR